MNHQNDRHAALPVIESSTRPASRRKRFVDLQRAIYPIVLLSLLLAGVLVIPPVAHAVDKAKNRAEKALREGEYTVAEKIYRDILTDDESDNQARLGLSFSLYKQRNLRDAFDHVARVIANDPLSARAHALMGAVILTSGDFRRSVEEFRTALSLRNDEALAVAGLAMVDLYENRLDQSFNGLRRATFIDPYEPDFVFDLGQVAARTERYREAADAYERFLAIAPKTDSDRRARIRSLIDFLRYIGEQGSLYDPSGKDRTVVPFEVGNDRPILNVRLNGSKEEFRFVLDTGSGMSVLSEETAKRIGVRPVARGGTARAVGGGGKFEIVYGFLTSIDLGDVRVNKVPVYIRKFYSAGRPVDGYIGLSVISNYLSTIDYGAHTLTLSKDRAEDSLSQWNSTIRDIRVTQAQRVGNPALELPLRITSSGFLSGEVHIEGISTPLNFIIDTGADVSVVAQRLADREELQRYARSALMRVFGAAGVAENVTMVILPQVSLGQHARKGVPAAILDLEPVNETAGFDQMGIIGANFLRFFRVTFDFKRAVVRLEPRDAESLKPQIPVRDVVVPEQP